jgi:putrescine---pyruvate transaminase
VRAIVCGIANRLRHRGIGARAAFPRIDKATKQLFPPAAGVTPKLTDVMLERGLYTGVVMDCICIAPPLVTSDAEIDRLVDMVGDAIGVVVAAAR